MSKKKATSDKTDERARDGEEDATFDDDDTQVSGPVATEEDGQRVETAESGPAAESRMPDVAPQRRGSAFVAWLALFTSILALIVFGVSVLDNIGSADDDGRADNAAVTAIADSVRSVQDSLASMQDDQTAMSGRLFRHDGAIDQLTGELLEPLRQIESIGGRMTTIENTVSSLQGISTGARDAWLLAEAEYYMQIANAQLQLAGNPELASLALGLADERILQLANPALTGVRRALANELRALEVMDKPDTAGVTLTLASLAGVVDSLPLRQEAVLPDDEDAAPDPELTGTSRALASLKSALDKAVSVRRVDEEVRPFIAPEARYFLRANLALQLQAARLSLLRGEAEIFEQSLDDAANWLTEYYDTDSTPVRSALQTIAEVRGSDLSVALPDISESLRLLRQFNAFADATSGTNAESIDEIAAEPEQ